MVINFYAWNVEQEGAKYNSLLCFYPDSKDRPFLFIFFLSTSMLAYAIAITSLYNFSKTLNLAHVENSFELMKTLF